MKIWKLGTLLSLTASFGLIACGDDSGSGAGDVSDEPYTCEVSDTKVVVKQNAGQYSITTTYIHNEDGTMTTRSEYGSGIPDVCSGEVAEAAKKAGDKAEMTCEDNVLTVVTSDKVSSEQFKAYAGTAAKVCEDPAAMGDPTKLSPDEEDEDDEDGDNSGSSNPGQTDSDGDDEGSSPSENPGNLDQETCTDGQTIDMGGLTMTCEGGEWVEDMEECTAANEGAKTTVLGIPAVCKDGEWEPDMEECTAANEGAKTNLMGVDVVCRNGEWEPDMEECTAANEGSTTTQNVMGLEVELVCLDGEWQEAPCTEGATKQENFLGMDVTMVCEDGSWEIDENSIMTPPGE
ncbi:hypothetical protein [uncultured Fibrobacter sp.]|uniref:hypothetical protein n=1 Tax=uncultured Fibrobacter sp. TaxID=261512 RepID=UPI00262F8F65|nr:hypothetical protein [uncultured Fibrobacter sp.]